MKNYLITLAFGAFFIFTACVKPKIYKAELAARSAAEAREKTLAGELGDRKAETAKLIETVAALNRTIGNHEKEITDLKASLSSNNRQLGESATKLTAEIASLNQRLEETKLKLADAETDLGKVKKAVGERRKTLQDLSDVLKLKYEGDSIKNAAILIENETIILTLPDSMLFKPTGLEISEKGKKSLKILADLLAARPSLDIDIIAYTDNVLPPKEKTLKDTWDWSLQRATNIARMLMREYNVNANQLTPIGRGEFYPIAANATAEGRQKNRRTSIVIRPVLTAITVAE